MRIVQIYELNPLESIGGVEIAVQSLSRELIKLGNEVTILTGAGNRGPKTNYDGFNVIDFDFLGLMKRTYSPGRLTIPRQFLFLSGVAAKMPRLKAEVYHGHIYTSGLLANYLAKRFNGVSVNTIHGSYYPVWQEITNPISASLYRLSERGLATFLARRSDLQIHVSTYFALQVALWGASPVVIPNGVDTRRFNGRVEASIDSDLPMILTARRLVKKNGVLYLLKAMEHLQEECMLYIIGDGPERHSLESIGKKLGNVRFLGEIQHSLIPGYIASADIAVVPSIIEASSLFMLEAMAMGKPVVASSVGGLPEVLEDAGLLVPPKDPVALADAIKILLRDKGMKKRLGSRSKAIVNEKYTWEKVAKRIEGEYKRLWSEKK